MRMRPMYQALCLVLLLIAGQQGALLHEIGHLSDRQGPAKHATEAPCDLCPAYAQAASPAFGHSFVFPALVLARFEDAGAPLVVAVDAAVPAPRSRGPPHSLS